MSGTRRKNPKWDKRRLHKTSRPAFAKGGVVTQGLNDDIANIVTVLKESEVPNTHKPKVEELRRALDRVGTEWAAVYDDYWVETFQGNRDLPLAKKKRVGDYYFPGLQKDLDDGVFPPKVAEVAGRYVTAYNAWKTALETALNNRKYDKHDRQDH